MTTYSMRWEGKPFQFRFFPLSPDPADKQGHEVYTKHPAASHPHDSS